MKEMQKTIPPPFPVDQPFGQGTDTRVAHVLPQQGMPQQAGIPGNKIEPFTQGLVVHNQYIAPRKIDCFKLWNTP